MSWWNQNWLGASGIAVGVTGILAAFWQRWPKRLDYNLTWLTVKSGQMG